MHSSLPQNRRLLFYTLFLAYICAGIISILPGPTLPLLAKHTGVPLAIAGWAFTFSAAGFVLGVLIAGVVSSRFGPKYLLLGGLAIMAFTGIVTPWTHLFLLLLAAQFVGGIGFGFLDVSINITVTLSFEDTLSETLNNLHSAYGVGALVAPLLLSLALELLHEAIWAYLVGSIAGLTGVFLLIRQPIPSVPKQNKLLQQQRAEATHDKSGHPAWGAGNEERPYQPRGRGVINHARTGASLPPPSSLSSVFRQTLLWLMALQLCLYVGAEIGFSNWIVTAVSQSAVISLALAAPAATAFWFGLTIGRLLGAQALKHGILSEKQLLYMSIIGGGISGLLVAAFVGQIGVSFGVSALIGLFFGPIFPGVMAIASRWFVHALSIVSGVMLISAGLSGMILPVLMGFLIPHIGFNWVMAIPALVCLSIAVPFYIALRQQHILHLRSIQHTMEQVLSITPQQKET